MDQTNIHSMKPRRKNSRGSRDPSNHNNSNNNKQQQQQSGLLGWPSVRYGGVDYDENVENDDNASLEIVVVILQKYTSFTTRFSH